MDSSHPRRHRSWFLAVISSVVLFLGSVVFAASASAQGAPREPANPDQGKSATAHSHASEAPRHQTHTRAHATGGGSSVSLSRPNDFQAQADPDGMTNGGVDQPGGTGGVDTSAQDGNNGSGNDADCEDDNRGVGIPGHCKVHTNQGHQHSGDQTDDVPGTTPETGGTTAEVPEAPAALVPVLPTLLPGLDTGLTTQVSAPGGDSSVLTRDNAVAGVSTTHASAASARTAAGILPNTGAGAALLTLTLGGLAALLVGGGLLRRSRANA
jgi:LPXTG-motif cell wall-anchored protein